MKVPDKTPKTWVDLVRKIWGYRRGKNQIEWLLWEGTSFPFTPNGWGVEWIEKQLVELHEKAKGDFKTAQKIKYAEEDAAWAKFKKENPSE